MVFRKNFTSAFCKSGVMQAGIAQGLASYFGDAAVWQHFAYLIFDVNGHFVGLLGRGLAENTLKRTNWNVSGFMTIAHVKLTAAPSSRKRATFEWCCATCVSRKPLLRTLNNARKMFHIYFLNVINVSYLWCNIKIS